MQEETQQEEIIQIPITFEYDEEQPDGTVIKIEIINGENIVYH